MSEAGPGSSAADESSPQTEQFLRLLGAHERSLFAYVYALTPNWQDAEEVMQRVRIRIWQQFDQYDSDKPFGAWARAIAYYLTLAYRKETNRQRDFFSERILRQVSDTYESLEESSNDRRTALLNCLKKLSDRNRQLVETYYLSVNESARDIASSLSMTPNALRQLMFRIRDT